MLTGRKIKGERRRRRWEAFHRRGSKLLSFDDVPIDERPHLLSRGVPLCLNLGTVRNWPLSKELLGRDVKYAVSLSFFDCGSRRFFGGTKMGHLVGGSAVKKSQDVVLGELMQWCTRVDDPKCVAIIELVACEVKKGHIVGQYGCGWTYLHLFHGDDTRVDIANAAEDEEYKELVIYDGTPRRIVAAAKKLDISRTTGGAEENLALAGGCQEVGGCSLSYRLRRHDGLLRCAHLIGDDEVLAPDDVIPGLAPWRCGNQKDLRLPPDNRVISGRRPMLGARAVGSAVVPIFKPKLAAEHVLDVSKIRVKIPNRAKLEQCLLRFVGFRATTSATSDKKKKREKIIGRRLAFGLHNGRGLTMRRTSPEGVARIDLAVADGDVLAASSSAEIKFKFRSFVGLNFLFSDSRVVRSKL